MNNVQKKELWQWAVLSKSFKLSTELAEIKQTFLSLCEDRTILFDKYALVDKQIGVCEVELSKLKQLVARIEFEPSDNVV